MTAAEMTFACDCMLGGSCRHNIMINIMSLFIRMNATFSTLSFIRQGDAHNQHFQHRQCHCVTTTDFFTLIYGPVDSIHFQVSPY